MGFKLNIYKYSIQKISLLSEKIYVTYKLKNNSPLLTNVGKQ